MRLKICLRKMRLSKFSFGKLLPSIVKKKLQNIYSIYKYNVKIGRGGYAHKVKFEENCKVGSFSQLTASSMGRSSYIGGNSIICYAEIGRYCAIGDFVRICLGNHPSSKIVSIHPCFYSLNGNTTESYVNEQLFQEHKFIDPDEQYVCRVGNDVWIGNNVTIFDGVTIGNGAIIGAGAVVTRDVEPYSIVAGVPAKIINYRFTDEQIIFLNRFKWWERDEEWLRENASFFVDINKMINHFN